ncbi:MAG: DUF1858 domain-containing protein [Bacteroidota bacterium]
MDKLVITPKTKIYDLLVAWPELEDVLIEAAPQFKKLKNPVLRRTITRVTNISQAAGVAGLNVQELVNKLRTAAGQDSLDVAGEVGQAYTMSRPAWFVEGTIQDTIDIRDMLNAGEQPVHEVLATLKKLEEDQILKIIAPFLPVPLLDKTLSLGYKHWVDKKSDEEFVVYVKTEDGRPKTEV